MPKNMIYHVPFPLGLRSNAASSIRPLRMLKAFQASGYNVVVVSGYVAERKQTIASIKRRISQGEKFDLLYSESSTMPTALTERDHIPRAPLMDYLFLHYCKKRGVKTGLFYRDIYWRFPAYGKNLSVLKKIVAKTFYYFELFVYKFILDTVYVPSLAMAAAIPFIPNGKFKPLPPGTHVSKKNPETVKCELKKLQLLFVGAVGDNYQMHELFSAVAKSPYVELIFCTPQEQWKQFMHEYSEFLFGNIEIVHKSGNELDHLYQKTDIAMLFVKQNPYWDFAVPVKIYEYMGHGKPIIASSGGQIERIINQYNAGWCTEYSNEALQDLFKKLHADKKKVQTVSTALCQSVSVHSWDTRATQVIADLAG